MGMREPLLCAQTASHDCLLLFGCTNTTLHIENNSSFHVVSLPRQDSNLSFQLQRLSCCRYTTGQYLAAQALLRQQENPPPRLTSAPACSEAGP